MAGVVTLKVSSMLWRSAKKHTPSNMDLAASCRTIRTSFGYLNPEGLAGVRGLSVSLALDPNEGAERTEAFFFKVCHGDGSSYPGYIGFAFDPATERLYCDILFPNLPSGKGLGLTLFTMILLRANAFAGKHVELRSVWRDSRKMTSRMRDFTPFTTQENDQSGGKNIILQVPTTNNDVLEAIEWYWMNILQMELC